MLCVGGLVCTSSFLVLLCYEEDTPKPVHPINFFTQNNSVLESFLPTPIPSSHFSAPPTRPVHNARVKGDPPPPGSWAEPLMLSPRRYTPSSKDKRGSGGSSPLHNPTGAWDGGPRARSTSVMTEDMAEGFHHHQHVHAHPRQMSMTQAPHFQTTRRVHGPPDATHADQPSLSDDLDPVTHFVSNKMLRYGGKGWVQGQEWERSQEEPKLFCTVRAASQSLGEAAWAQAALFPQEKEREASSVASALNFHYGVRRYDCEGSASRRASLGDGAPTLTSLPLNEADLDTFRTLPAFYQRAVHELLPRTSLRGLYSARHSLVLHEPSPSRLNVGAASAHLQRTQYISHIALLVCLNVGTVPPGMDHIAAAAAHKVPSSLPFAKRDEEEELLSCGHYKKKGKGKKGGGLVCPECNIPTCPVLECWLSPRQCGERKAAAEVITAALKKQYAELGKSPWGAVGTSCGSFARQGHQASAADRRTKHTTDSEGIADFSKALDVRNCHIPDNGPTSSQPHHKAFTFPQLPAVSFKCFPDTVHEKLQGLTSIGNAVMEAQKRAREQQDGSTGCAQACASTKPQQRVLIHYNGHGVPEPSHHSEVWVFDEQYSQYIPMRLREVAGLVRAPVTFVLDVRKAQSVIESLTKESDTHVLAASSTEAQLPSNAYFPADTFTSCLLTPLPIAVLHHMYYNISALVDLRKGRGASEDVSDNEDDDDDDDDELLYGCETAVARNMSYARIVLDCIEQGSFADVFASLEATLHTVLATIAFDCMQPAMYASLIKGGCPRQEHLFLNFFLANRVMSDLGVVPVSHPKIPGCHQRHHTSSHPLWATWDTLLENAISDLLRRELCGRKRQKPPAFNGGGVLSFFDSELSTARAEMEANAEGSGSNNAHHATQCDDDWSMMASAAPTPQGCAHPFHTTPTLPPERSLTGSRIGSSRGFMFGSVAALDESLHNADVCPTCGTSTATAEQGPAPSIYRSADPQSWAVPGRVYSVHAVLVEKALACLNSLVSVLLKFEDRVRVEGRGGGGGDALGSGDESTEEMTSPPLSPSFPSIRPKGKKKYFDNFNKIEHKTPPSRAAALSISPREEARNSIKGVALRMLQSRTVSYNAYAAGSTGTLEAAAMAAKAGLAGDDDICRMQGGFDFSYEQEGSEDGRGEGCGAHTSRRFAGLGSAARSPTDITFVASQVRDNTLAMVALMLDANVTRTASSLCGTGALFQLGLFTKCAASAMGHHRSGPSFFDAKFAKETLPLLLFSWMKLAAVAADGVVAHSLEMHAPFFMKRLLEEVAGMVPGEDSDVAQTCDSVNDDDSDEAVPFMPVASALLDREDSQLGEAIWSGHSSPSLVASLPPRMMHAKKSSCLHGLDGGAGLDSLIVSPSPAKHASDASSSLISPPPGGNMNDQNTDLLRANSEADGNTLGGGMGGMGGGLRKVSNRSNLAGMCGSSFGAETELDANASFMSADGLRLPASGRLLGGGLSLMPKLSNKSDLAAMFYDDAGNTAPQSPASQSPENSMASMGKARRPGNLCIRIEDDGTVTSLQKAKEAATPDAREEKLRERTRAARRWTAAVESCARHLRVHEAAAHVAGEEGEGGVGQWGHTIGSLVMLTATLACAARKSGAPLKAEICANLLAAPAFDPFMTALAGLTTSCLGEPAPSVLHPCCASLLHWMLLMYTTVAEHADAGFLSAFLEYKASRGVLTVEGAEGEVVSSGEGWLSLACHHSAQHVRAAAVQLAAVLFAAVTRVPDPCGGVHCSLLSLVCLGTEDSSLWVRLAAVRALCIVAAHLKEIIQPTAGPVQAAAGSKTTSAAGSGRTSQSLGLAFSPSSYSDRGTQASSEDCEDPTTESCETDTEPLQLAASLAMSAALKLMKDPVPSIAAAGERAMALLKSTGVVTKRKDAMSTPLHAAQTLPPTSPVLRVKNDATSTDDTSEQDRAMPRVQSQFGQTTPERAARVQSPAASSVFGDDEPLSPLSCALPTFFSAGDTAVPRPTSLGFCALLSCLAFTKTLKGAYVAAAPQKDTHEVTPIACTPTGTTLMFSCEMLHDAAVESLARPCLNTTSDAEEAKLCRQRKGTARVLERVFRYDAAMCDVGLHDGGRRGGTPASTSLQPQRSPQTAPLPGNSSNTVADPSSLSQHLGGTKKVCLLAEYDTAAPTATPHAVRGPVCPQQYPPRILAAHPTSCLLVYASSAAVKVWDWKNNVLRNVVKVHEVPGGQRSAGHSVVSGVRIAAGLPLCPLVTTTLQGVVNVHVDWNTFKQAALVASFPTALGLSQDFECVSNLNLASHTEPAVWASSTSARVNVFDLTTEQLSNTFNLTETADITQICTPSDRGCSNLGFVGHSNGIVSVLDHRTKGCWKLGTQTNGAAVSSLVHGELYGGGVACLGTDGALRVWDLRKVTGDGGVDQYAKYNLCKKGQLKDTALHPMLPLVMTCSGSSVRMHNVVSSAVTVVSSAERVGAASGLFKAKLPPILTAVFHPLLPSLFASCADGKLLHLA